jgi:hypothetical protein
MGNSQDKVMTDAELAKEVSSLRKRKAGKAATSLFSAEVPYSCAASASATPSPPNTVTISAPVAVETVRAPDAKTITPPNTDIVLVRPTTSQIAAAMAVLAIDKTATLVVESAASPNTATTAARPIPDYEFMGVWKMNITPELVAKITEVKKEKYDKWRFVDLKVPVHFFEVWFYGNYIRMFEVPAAPKDTPEWNGYDEFGVWYDDTAVMIEPLSSKNKPIPADCYKRQYIV